MPTIRKRLRTAVIGAGHLGGIHAKLLRQNPNFDLVAVCDPQPLVQQRMIQELDVRVVSQYQKILGEVEAAVIATPTILHAEIALACLEADVHLFIEKPMTADILSARQIEQLAAERNLVVQVGHVERYNPAIACALAAVGAPRFMSSVRASGYPFRSTDIGVVLDLMIHDIDLAAAMFDSPIAEVNAWGSSLLGGHEDVAFAYLNFANGGAAQLQASRCSPWPQRELHIYGCHGFAKVDLAQHKVQVVHYPQWLQQGEIDIHQLPAELQTLARERFFQLVLPHRAVDVEPINAIAAEHAEWSTAIRSGKSPRVTLRQAVAAVDIASRICHALAARRDRDPPAECLSAFGGVAPKSLPDFPVPAPFQMAIEPRRAA